MSFLNVTDKPCKREYCVGQLVWEEGKLKCSLCSREDNPEPVPDFVLEEVRIAQKGRRGHLGIVYSGGYR